MEWELANVMENGVRVSECNGEWNGSCNEDWMGMRSEWKDNEMVII